MAKPNKFYRKDGVLLPVPKKVTIYTQHDPRDGEMRYVGKTINTVNKRNYRNQPVAAWIHGLATFGLSPKSDVAEVVPEDEWEVAEKFWIDLMRSYGVRLLNVTEGGFSGPPAGYDAQAAYIAAYDESIALGPLERGRAEHPPVWPTEFSKNF